MSDPVIEGSDAEITKEEIAQAAAEFKAATIDADTFILEETPDGRREILKFEDDANTVRIAFSHDLTAFQENCRAAFNEPVDRKSEFRHIAAIPQDVLRMWGQERGLNDPFWFMNREHQHLVVRAAHDRDLSQFRVAPGHYLKRGS